jgi:PAS domain S-box-containing protein
MQGVIGMSSSSVQQYFEFADVIMIAISSDETVIDVNLKCCKFLGCSRGEVVNRNWFDSFVPEAVRENSRFLFHEMLRGSLRHIHSEYPVVSKTGGELVVNWHNMLVTDERGNTIGALSSGIDVTEMRKAGKAMKEVENRLQTTLDSMLEGCQIIDYDWRYAYINEAGARQGRRTKKELLGHTMMEMYPGIEKTEVFSYLRDCMNRRIAHKMENEFVFPDGSKGWFELRIEPVPEGVLILSMDITEQRKLAEELRRYRGRLEVVVADRTAQCAKVNEQLKLEIEEHQRLEQGLMLRSAILDNVREAIFLVGMKGEFVYANEAACKTYGYGCDEFLNMTFRQLFPSQEASVADIGLSEVVEKGAVDLETVHLRKNGSSMPVKMLQSLIDTSRGQFVVAVVREISK